MGLCMQRRNRRCRGMADSEFQKAQWQGLQVRGGRICIHVPQGEGCVGLSIRIMLNILGCCKSLLQLKFKTKQTSKYNVKAQWDCSWGKWVISSHLDPSVGIDLLGGAEVTTESWPRASSKSSSRQVLRLGRPGLFSFYLEGTLAVMERHEDVFPKQL